MTYAECKKKKQCPFDEVCRYYEEHQPKQQELETNDGYYLQDKPRMLGNYIPGEKEIF